MDEQGRALGALFAMSLARGIASVRRRSPSLGVVPPRLPRRTEIKKAASGAREVDGPHVDFENKPSDQRTLKKMLIFLLKLASLAATLPRRVYEFLAIVSWWPVALDKSLQSRREKAAFQRNGSGCSTACEESNLRNLAG